jgi:hypothetical protein
MPPLFPPDYPECPDAPLLSFGPSFSEEISRSVIAAVWHDNHDRPHETEVRIAASLTMFEAFHPRDHLECMLAAQAVGMHAAIMDNMERAMHPDTPLAMTIKLRGSAAQMSRVFSGVMHDLERRQSKPLPERPAPAPDLPPTAPPGTPPPGPGNGPSEPELPDDLVTRPDGTPGTFAAYAPKPPQQVFIPREAPIMVALATRPKPWRQVNIPKDGGPTGERIAIEPAAVASAEPAELPVRLATRGPLDARERIFTGDGLSRFAATRLDPNIPFGQPDLADDEATFELEMISTGGDPEAEAERAAMMAAHPEGKPIVTYRYGTRKPPGDPPRDE